MPKMNLIIKATLAPPRLLLAALRTLSDWMGKGTNFRARVAILALLVIHCRSAAGREQGNHIRGGLSPKTLHTMVVGRILEVDQQEQEHQEYMVPPVLSSKIPKAGSGTGGTTTMGVEQNDDMDAATPFRILKPNKGKDGGKNSKKDSNPKETKSGKKEAKAASQPPTPSERSAQYGLQVNCFQDDPSKFNICLDLASSDGTYKSWMEDAIAARDRWENIITGDPFPARDTQDLRNISTATTLPPAIDDIYIAIFEVNIDGVDKVLGSTVTNFFRRNSDDHFLPAAARILLDTADIARMQARNTIRGVLEHEMGHALGFGKHLFARNGLVSGNDTDLVYNGQNARQAWKDMGCSGKIPIETDGAPGKAGSHWDEECLNKELMTGAVDIPMYLSLLTIGALMDLGYSVNINAAEPFTLDQLSQSQCAAYCPEATGDFTVEDGGTAVPGIAASSYYEGNTTAEADSQGETANREAILSAAAATLQENRVNAPLTVPEGYEYVGGDFVTVLTAGPNGRLQGTLVSWDEVQDFLATSDPQIVV